MTANEGNVVTEQPVAEPEAPTPTELQAAPQPAEPVAEQPPPEQAATQFQSAGLLPLLWLSFLIKQSAKRFREFRFVLQSRGYSLSELSEHCPNCTGDLQAFSIGPGVQSRA